MDDLSSSGENQTRRWLIVVPGALALLLILLPALLALALHLGSDTVRENHLSVAEYALDRGPGLVAWGYQFAFRFSSSSVRLDMAHDLHDSGALEGRSKDDVGALLGQGGRTEAAKWTYRVNDLQAGYMRGTDLTFAILFDDSDRVISVGIAEREWD